jgi:hypothetical protein
MKNLSKKFFTALDTRILAAVLIHKLIHSVLVVASLNQCYSSVTIIPLTGRKKINDLPSISFAAVITHSINLLFILI